MSMPTTVDLIAGALAFLRVSAILFAMPVFGDTPTPIRTRVLLSLAITVGVFPGLPVGWMPEMNVGVLAILGYALRELVIGLTIGFIARLAFAGLVMAASVVSYQMGFGTSNLFMPDAGIQMDAFTAFHRIVLMLMFLALNLHHIFIGSIADSFQLIGGGAAQMDPDMGLLFIELSANIFAVSIQLAAPVIIALLFTMAALGLIARTVPQMNVFTLSFPASFFLGLAVYAATFPFFPQWIREHYLQTHESVLLAIRGMI